jgi:two-component system response regulator RegA
MVTARASVGWKTASWKILIVDDDERFLTAVSRSVEPGAAIVTAKTAASAQKVARESKPDLAIIDLRLDGDSGVKLIPELKREHPEMRIALVSSYLSVVSAVAAVQAGADHVLSKPFTIKDAIRWIDGEVAEEDLDETPTLARVEWEHIMRVLHDCDGNLSLTARRLGIYRSTLKRRIRKFAPV